jgi:hypothetical protein
VKVISISDPVEHQPQWQAKKDLNVCSVPAFCLQTIKYKFIFEENNVFAWPLFFVF